MDVFPVTDDDALSVHSDFSEASEMVSATCVPTNGGQKSLGHLLKTFLEQRKDNYLPAKSSDEDQFCNNSVVSTDPPPPPPSLQQCCQKQTVIRPG